MNGEQNLENPNPMDELEKKRKLKGVVKVYVFIGIIILTLILLVSISVAKANQRLQVSMVEVSVDELIFEPMEAINQWHNQEAKFVYLTFNDGPSDNTLKIMDILEKYDVKGTFFVLGNSIHKQPNSETILTQMVKSGHYIGLHSMTRDSNHLYGHENAPQNFLDEMLELQTLVSEKSGGFESSLCRPPLGSRGTLSEEHINLILNANLNCWDWHIDARDWSSLTTVEDVLDHMETGMMLWRNANRIVVLFQESDVAIEALPEVIDFFQNLGYEFFPYSPKGHFPVNSFNHRDL